MNYLISYDISNNRLRLKAAKRILRAGLHRIQLSVFIGEMRDSVTKALLLDLNQLTTQKDWKPTDSIFFLPLHQYSEDHQKVIGNQHQDWDLIYQKLHTLVL